MIFRYLWYVIRHKWHVFIECCRLGVPWLGVVHDLSKFLPSEMFAYMKYFTVPRVTGAELDLDTEHAFNIAWLHHQKRNKHHWQYWLLQYDNCDSWSVQERSESNVPLIACDTIPWLSCESDCGDDPLHRRAKVMCNSIVEKLNYAVVCLPMPDKYRREMLADWRGAGRALGKPDTRAWYLANRNKIILHDETRQWIEEKLGAS